MSNVGARREDPKKSGLTGAQLAATLAIGAGIGAAVYYFFSKEGPSTSRSSEEAQHRQQSLSNGNSESEYEEDWNSSEDADITNPNENPVPQSPKFRDRVHSLEICSICHEPLLEEEDESKVRLALPCGHLFHQFCVSPWIESHNSCPNCRQSADV